MITSIIVGAASFIFGVGGALLLMHLYSKRGRRRAKPKHAAKRKIGVMNVALVAVVVIFVWFTHEMIELFKTYMAVPDAVVAGVYAVLGGECGFLGWIKTSKERAQERKWMKEDIQQIGSPDDGPKG